MWHGQDNSRYVPNRAQQLADLSERLRLARRRRLISTELFAERMGVSRETLRRLENGDPTIAMGTYRRALRVSGLDSDIDGVARDDLLGQKKRAPSVDGSVPHSSAGLTSFIPDSSGGV